MPLGPEEVANRTGFHKGTDETIPLHAAVRRQYNVLMNFLDGFLPDGRAKSLAFTELEASEMWANKAIAELAPLVDEGMTPQAQTGVLTYGTAEEIATQNAVRRGAYHRGTVHYTQCTLHGIVEGHCPCFASSFCSICEPEIEEACYCGEKDCKGHDAGETVEA